MLFAFVRPNVRRPLAWGALILPVLVAMCLSLAGPSPASALPAAQSAPTFADVPFDHPYHDQIEALYQGGYTSGCSTNPLMYCPEQTMNRAESAVFLERGIHSATFNPPTPSSQVFADLPLDSWAAGWVNGLWQDQYTAGCGTNPLMYCPWQGHTRAEGAVFYLRMLHGANYAPPEPTQQTFADVPLGTWYAKWAQAAYDAGLVPPCETFHDLRFCPDGPLTRGLAAYMMVQAKKMMQPAAAYEISAPEEETFYAPFAGFGAEWDPFFWNVYNQSRGLNQADWDLITSRIKEMKVPIVRMYTQYYFATFDPDLHVWNYDNRRMQSLYKYLDFACTNNIDVMLDEWNWGFWQNYQGNALDYRYAQGIASFVKELLVNRGYTCIKYLLIGNEPDYEFLNQFPFATLQTLIQNIDRELRDAGIRDLIKFVGPEEACCGSVMVPSIEGPLHAVYDGYDRHGYATTAQISSGNLWWELEQYRQRYVREYSPDPATDMQKPQFVTEAGNFDAGHDSFTYALNMADYGTTALNTTIQGVIAWHMFDIYYDFGRSEWDNNAMIDGWGLWKYKDQSWALRPWSQSWGLLVKFAPRGSLKAAVSYPGGTGPTPPNFPPTGPVRVAGVKRPDGGWSLFLVNQNASSTTIQVNLPDSSSHLMDRYSVDNTTLAAYPSQIIVPPAGTQTITHMAKITLPAKSFTVLVEKPLYSVPTPDPWTPKPTPVPTPTPAPTCTPSPSNFCPPIGEWKFDEGTGTTIHDSSGNGNDGIVFGQGTGWNNGKYGKAVSLNGADGNYVRIDNGIMPANAYTKAAWVNWFGGDRGNIMSSGLGSVNHTFGVLSNAFDTCESVAQQLAAGHNATHCSVVDPAKFPSNSWVHVALTYDSTVNGGTLKLYKNGSLVDSATNVPPVTDDPFVNIGAWGWWSVFNGLIDQARLYDYALADSQIVQDMNDAP